MAPVVHPRNDFVGVEVTRLISILDSTHHLTPALSPNSVGGEGDAFVYSLTGVALVFYALGGMFMVPIQKMELTRIGKNGCSGNRIRAKKEGNLFRSPNRNCEKL
jgi:hypothetical protein